MSTEQANQQAVSAITKSLREAGAAKRAEGERRMTVTRESLLETLARIRDLTVPDPAWPVSDRATLDQIRKVADRVLMRAALQSEAS